MAKAVATKAAPVERVAVESRVAEQPKAEQRTEQRAEPNGTQSVVKPKLGSTLFNLSAALSGGVKGGESEESSEMVDRRYDPNTQSKIEAFKSQIIKYLSDSRPRFVPFFELMQVEGSQIKLSVPSEDLRLEILRNDTQLLTYIIEGAKIDGVVELVIDIAAMAESKRPVRLEDRIAHFTQMNPAIVELTELLDMQVDG